jgi:hypothetical protein
MRGCENRPHIEAYTQCMVSNYYQDRMRVFESTVLKLLCGLEREEITTGLRKLHNEELHNCYF